MTPSQNQIKKVPLLDLQAQYETIRDEIRAAVDRVFDSQQFILGAEVQAFEEEIARYSQTKFAIGCASGSDALLLALMSCGVGAGDEVITSPFSFSRPRAQSPGSARGWSFFTVKIARKELLRRRPCITRESQSTSVTAGKW